MQRRRSRFSAVTIWPTPAKSQSTTAFPTAIASKAQRAFANTMSYRGRTDSGLATEVPAPEPTTSRLSPIRLEARRTAGNCAVLLLKTRARLGLEGNGPGGRNRSKLRAFQITSICEDGISGELSRRFLQRLSTATYRKMRGK